MEQPAIQIGQYILGKNLGIGAFGKVRLADYAVGDRAVSIKIGPLTLTDACGRYFFS